MVLFDIDPNKIHFADVCLEEVWDNRDKWSLYGISEQLIDSVKRIGILDPVIVYTVERDQHLYNILQKSFEIVHPGFWCWRGTKRLRIARYLGIKTVPVLLLDETEEHKPDEKEVKALYGKPVELFHHPSLRRWDVRGLKDPVAYNSDWIVVAFYTNDNYQEESKRLVSSLEKMGINHVVKKLPDLGSWIKNGNLKPFFIRDMLEETNKNVVYLDVDSEVVKYPSLFDSPTHDVGLFVRGESDYRCGTMYFSNSHYSRTFLDKWIAETRKSPDKNDQENIKTYIDRENPVFDRLPMSYCTKFDGTQGNVDDGVIIHYMASRKYKV